MRSLFTTITTICLISLNFASPAHAQETIDVGVLKNQDLKVVQKQLYTKTDLKEFAVHAGVMPFDAFSITPKIEFSYANYFTDTLAWEGALGVGYGFKNSNYKQLAGPAYGIEPDVYRYLTSAIGNLQWAPVYAKMAYNGSNIFHYDVYGLAGGGLSVEQSFLPDKDLSFAPTVALGLGSRIFLADGSTLRIQIRNDVLFQQRAKTLDKQALYLKQNTTLSVGYTFDLRKMAKNAATSVSNKVGGSK